MSCLLSHFRGQKIIGNKSTEGFRKDEFSFRIHFGRPENQ